MPETRTPAGERIERTRYGDPQHETSVGEPTRYGDPQHDPAPTDLGRVERLRYEDRLWGDGGCWDGEHRNVGRSSDENHEEERPAASPSPAAVETLA